MENVHSNDEYNVFAHGRQHIEKPASINDTYVMKKVDSNITPDSMDIKAEMLTKQMAKNLSVASEGECLFANFLSKDELKKASESLKHPGWVDWLFRNKKDEIKAVIRNKDRLVAQGYWQEAGIDYDAKFAQVARLEAIRIFLAFATYMNFTVYQMDVKSAFLNGNSKEEVYVQQPLGLESSEFPNHVCKLGKALYGVKQAPRAWYETLSTFLTETYVILVQVYLKGTSSLGRWYLKCSGFDLKGYLSSDYVECIMKRKSTSGACELLRSKLVCWSAKKQQYVAMSFAEAEYVADAGCCANILWMKSRLRITLQYSVSHADADVDVQEVCASLSKKFRESYFIIKFGISGLLHHVVITIADRIRELLVYMAVHVIDAFESLKPSWEKTCTLRYGCWFGGKLIQKLRQKGVYEESFSNTCCMNWGEVNPTHANYNGSKTSKDTEDPSWSTSIKTSRQRRHLQQWKRFGRLYLVASLKEASEAQKGHSKKRKKSTMVKDENPSQPSASTHVVAQMRKDDLQATSGKTSLGVTGEERADQLSSIVSASISEPIYSASTLMHSKFALGRDTSTTFTAKIDPKTSC
ncbi:retrovirus-related pol polyprotein from transposon TNT 1-94 [Tanacetum coccineum]|uniref:Retrovirus-related pol polyprotein from transposon TNT 1-94 n=1 Tax=Tanacetum coccineum TaxID=301880 RepID=A0ABQ4Y6W9_9ASTR